MTIIRTKSMAGALVCLGLASLASFIDPEPAAARTEAILIDNLTVNAARLLPVVRVQQEGGATGLYPPDTGALADAGPL